MLRVVFDERLIFRSLSFKKIAETTARYTLNSAQQWRTRDLIFPGFSQKTNTLNSAYKDCPGTGVV